MSIFIVTETGAFLVTEDDSFLILQETIARDDVRRKFMVMPRTTEFKVLPRTTEFKVLPRITEFALTGRRELNMLEISPTSEFEMDVGEEYAYTLALTQELKSKTVASYTYKVYDSSDTEATATIGGGSSIDTSNIILFGVKAVATGKYTLRFVVTCNDLLPDEATPYELNIEMTVTIS